MRLNAEYTLSLWRVAKDKKKSRLILVTGSQVPPPPPLRETLRCQMTFLVPGWELVLCPLTDKSQKDVCLFSLSVPLLPESHPPRAQVTNPEKIRASGTSFLLSPNIS